MRGNNGTRNRDYLFINTLEAVKDYSTVKNYIVFRIVSGRDMDLTERVFTKAADLFVIYDIEARAGSGSFLKIGVTYDLMEEWEISLSELHSTALVNTQVLYPFVMRTLANQLGLEDTEMGSPIYVLTNEEIRNGASVLLYTGMIEMLQSRFEEGFYILPSSVHEFLIVPKQEDMTVSQLQNIVQTVNEYEVREEEYLSDQVYRIRNGKLAIAKDEDQIPDVVEPDRSWSAARMVS